MYTKTPMNEPIIIEYKVNAPLEKVWTALTVVEEIKIWYFDIPDFKPELFEIFNFYEPGPEKKYHHQAQILEIIPNRKLKHTWHYPGLSKGKTVVTWELQPEQVGVIIRVTHDEIENLKDLGENFTEEAFLEGWHEIIGYSLKSYLEKNNEGDN